MISRPEVFSSPSTGVVASHRTVASTIMDILFQLGVREAFGVSGGSMAALWHALSESVETFHFRHEGGAAFAATEAHLATDRPVALFTTTGPGLTNALTGLLAARDEGAKIIVLSAFSSVSHRGRYAVQETSTFTMPSDLYTAGPLFHFAAVLEHPTQLPQIARRLVQGVARKGGFIAHLAVPTALQSAPTASVDLARLTLGDDTAAPGLVHRCAAVLRQGTFAVWVGFGARHASEELRRFIEHTGAPVFCTPRGKGIFPESDRRFLGVTGMGGHETVASWVAERQLGNILVLGTRLGEPSSFWDPRFSPRDGFVHVDLDPTVFGTAYPSIPTLGVCGDIQALLRDLAPCLPEGAAGITDDELPAHTRVSAPSRRDVGRVRPEMLMHVLQQHVVERSNAVVLAESGNSFIWTTHRLRFDEPGRYRVSTGTGAMGHATSGVVGVALSTGTRAVAVVGDGSMLMNNELNTAVKFGAKAVWVVLNDARYGMCAQGMATLGLTADAEFPEVDFVGFAQSQGAEAVRVESERELDAAFARAMVSPGPFVIDVLIDRSCRAPSGGRNRTLASQMNNGGTTSSLQNAPSNHNAPSSSQSGPCPNNVVDLSFPPR